MRQRAFATTLAAFLAYTPTEFEDAVASVFRAAGYSQMKRVGGSGDLSIDLVGRDATGRSVLLQCKRYAPGKALGSPVIQQFYGMSHYRDPSARAACSTRQRSILPAQLLRTLRPLSKSGQASDLALRGYLNRSR